jgi:hypothetical protein
MSDLIQQVAADGFAVLARYRPESSASEVVSFLGEADTIGAHGPVHQLKPALAETRPLNIQRHLWFGHVSAPHRHGSLARPTAFSDAAVPARVS